MKGCSYRSHSHAATGPGGGATLRSFTDPPRVLRGVVQPGPAPQAAKHGMSLPSSTPWQTVPGARGPGHYRLLDGSDASCNHAGQLTAGVLLPSPPWLFRSLRSVAPAPLPHVADLLASRAGCIGAWLGDEVFLRISVRHCVVLWVSAPMSGHAHGGALQEPFAGLLRPLRVVGAPVDESLSRSAPAASPMLRDQPRPYRHGSRASPGDATLSSAATRVSRC